MLAAFDSSALVKLVVEETGSAVAARMWDDADAVVASRLVVPEVTAALSAAQRASRLNPAAHQRALDDWTDYRTLLRLVELTPVTALEAAALAERLVLGGADAVHLASALALDVRGAVLVVWDLRLRVAAETCCVRIAPAVL